MHPLAHCPPILSCEAARAFEQKLFAGDEAREWRAMQAAGHAVADAVLRDFQEIGGFRANGRMLVLVGKGHNGGDALIATQSMLMRFPEARADVVFVFGERSLRPLAARAWRDLVHSARDRVSGIAGALRAVPEAGGTPAVPDAVRSSIDLCLDGIFGFQFRPPANAAIAELIAEINARPIRLRAAVDLPSAGLFRADFTYATGSVKLPVVDALEAGRVRYLDLDFFRGDEIAEHRVLTCDVLAPLAGLRPARGDKRTYGHVFVIGGSRSFPGAILMTVLAALRSGAGLVTAFVPESVAGAFAARAPEAMWVGWPETPTGGLALEGEHLLRERLARATALVVGPGLGREPETLALVTSIVKSSAVPIVIDADALQPEIVAAGNASRIVTPHAGEFKRIAQNGKLKTEATVVLKGPVTRVWHEVGTGGLPVRGRVGHATRPQDISQPETAATYHSFFGGPALARGGSGDLLAGLIGGLLAQTPDDPLLAAARGVVWHGMAADALARAHGQAPVSVTQLLDFLPAALRESAHEHDPMA